MKASEYLISFGGHELLLSSQRAIYWPYENTLILSDLHLGKAAHFRKNGIAVPTSISEQDLLRLKQLIIQYNPRKVIVVGDLIHAGSNKEVALFRNLTAQFEHVRFVLIKGNHDRHNLQQLNNLGIYDSRETLDINGLYLAHHPLQHDLPTISGHIHPGISIRMPNKKNIRLPCYVVSDSQLILPAFSLFTGLDTQHIAEDATCYAIYEGRIFNV